MKTPDEWLRYLDLARDSFTVTEFDIIEIQNDAREELLEQIRCLEFDLADARSQGNYDT